MPKSKRPYGSPRIVSNRRAKKLLKMGEFIEWDLDHHAQVWFPEFKILPPRFPGDRRVQCLDSGKEFHAEPTNHRRPDQWMYRRWTNRQLNKNLEVVNEQA